MRLDMDLPSDGARPTPRGYRRRPKTRDHDMRRPGTVSRGTFSFSLAWMIAHERAAAERARASEEG